jgi:peptide/nickel transport system permease protein
MDVSGVILTMAGLSFLGLGAPEPQPDLGSMSATGLTYLLSDGWVAVMPGAMVFILGYTANIAGDALRDFLKASETK